jgi:hypothetical protein
MSKIKELLDDIRKVRNDLVAQSNPHFQDLTNIIYKWETRLATQTSNCSCGRSPTGICIGWHSLTEEKYKEKKKKYDDYVEEHKDNPFHARAIDGFGE